MVYNCNLYNALLIVLTTTWNETDNQHPPRNSNQDNQVIHIGNDNERRKFQVYYQTFTDCERKNKIVNIHVNKNVIHLQQPENLYNSFVIPMFAM